MGNILFRSSGLGCLSRATGFNAETIPGDGAVSLWVRVSAPVSGLTFVFTDNDGVWLGIGANGGIWGFTTSGGVGDLVTERPLNTWAHFLISNENGVGFTVYCDGVSIGTDTNLDDRLNGIAGLFTFQGGEPALATTLEIAGFCYFGATVDATQAAALAALSPLHDPRMPSPDGDWPGMVPVQENVSAPVSGTYADTGSSEDAPLQATGSVVAEAISTTVVPRIGSINRYPPIRTFYRFPGTTGANLRAVSPTIPRLVYPIAGGWGTFTWRFWLRRPLAPSVTTGTVIQVGLGDHTITVGVDAGDLVVTISDGTDTAIGTATQPLAGFTWEAITLQLETAADNTLTLYIGSTEVVGIIDPGAGLVIPLPDITTGFSFTIGSDADGSNPLDFDLADFVVYDVLLGEDGAEVITKIEPQIAEGWTFDVRNPTGDWDPVDGDDPLPIIQYIDLADDDVIPDAGEDGDSPLVAFSIEIITEPSTFTEEVGEDSTTVTVGSDAWWGDTEGWDITADDGRPIEIVDITYQEDGSLLFLLSDFTFIGTTYTLTGPPDLAGTDFVPFVFEGTVDPQEEQFFAIFQELLPPGPIWETADDPDLELLCEALSLEQARVFRQTQRIVPEGRPFSTDLLVPEWEEVFALPDDCHPVPSTQEGRQAAIRAAFLSRGGQTARYYINLINQTFGVVGSYIEENYPYGTYFRAGDGTEGSGSAAGDTVGSMSDSLTFRVNVPAAMTQEMADRLECLINRVKPSHTNVVYNINTVG